MSDSKLETATLGGGCFWCIEAIYRKVKGVEEVVSGYSGGDMSHPTYGHVHSGMTGHAEAIQIKFDPNIISYEQILDIFWKVHDPTTLNRQGHDVGTQYRSIIFYHDEKQKEIAERSKMKLESSHYYPDSIVTEIVQYKNFYRAEDFMQDFYNNYRNQPYCRIIIDPKIKEFLQEFKDMAKE